MTIAAQAEGTRAPAGLTTPTLSPEWEVLLACARAYASASASPAVLPQALNWELLLREARHHGLTSLLRRWLAATPIPEPFRETLDERYRENVRYGLKHTAVLVEVMTLFRSAGLSALPYKGPALSAQIFGDPALREAVDLDILVPQDEVNAACARLIGIGFALLRQYAPGIERQLLRYRAEIGMMRDGVLVEIQWRLAPHYFSVPIDVQAMFARATHVQVAGAELPALSIEDNLLVLCVHGAKHHWQSLRWVLDVALVVRKNPQLNWAILQQRAQSTGTERLLFLGLRLAETLLQAPIPEQIRQAIRRDEELEPIAQEMLKGFASKHLATEAEHHRLMLRLRERFIDRARYVCRLSWQPTESEWGSVALPPSLHFVYHGIRLGRVVAKAFTSLSA